MKSDCNPSPHIKILREPLLSKIALIKLKKRDDLNLLRRLSKTNSIGFSVLPSKKQTYITPTYGNQSRNTIKILRKRRTANSETPLYRRKTSIIT